MDREVRFTDVGRQFAVGTVVGKLVARLLVQDGLKRRPDCLARTIRRPLVITGIPQSGSIAPGIRRMLKMPLIAGRIASSSGRPMAIPALLRQVLRGSGNMSQLLIR